MDPMDAPNTTFMSNHGNYYYNAMPFKLKNVETTYQRLKDTMISNKIWYKLDVYIDDMIMKTLKGESHATNLEDILGPIRNSNMCLNPNKCLFGV